MPMCLRQFKDLLKDAFKLVGWFFCQQLKSGLGLYLPSCPTRCQPTLTLQVPFPMFPMARGSWLTSWCPASWLTVASKLPYWLPSRLRLVGVNLTITYSRAASIFVNLKCRVVKSVHNKTVFCIILAGVILCFQFSVCCKVDRTISK